MQLKQHCSPLAPILSLLPLGLEVLLGSLPGHSFLLDHLVLSGMPTGFHDSEDKSVVNKYKEQEQAKQE